MRWLETVRDCTCDEAAVHRFLSAEFLRHLQDLRGTAGCASADVYREEGVPGSFAIIVAWSGDGPPRKSRELAAMADYASGIGLVNHSVWSQIDISGD